MPRKNRQQPHKPFKFESSCQNKVRYNRKSEADEAIEIASLERPHVSLENYQCPRCQGWHLTSIK